MASAIPSPTPSSTPSPIPRSNAANAQGLDPVLLEVLACPAEHHAPLRLGGQDDPNAPSLTCTECGRVFPIRDGIPVLLLDEATSGGPSLDSAAGR
jgi:uncharacterized protein YbaR (Trm112 family)